MARFEKILLGATTNNTLVFANINITFRNGFREFSVSFDEVNPFVATDELLTERAEGSLECFNGDEKYNLCKLYECKPSELVHEFCEDQLRNYGVGGIMDISLYSESFSIKGAEADIYFESDGCGQHDTRKFLIPIDRHFSEWVHYLWEQYHLKEITQEIEKELVGMIDDYTLNTVNKEEWIQSWLELHDEVWS